MDSHTRALETTHAVTLLRPFHGGGQKELAKAPKLYAFDTGFVSFGRGWDPLRTEDYGLLWEHVVLEYLQARAYEWKLHYWRDAMGREIDFIIPGSRDQVDAIECKWDPKQLDPTALKVLRSYYPHGANYLVSPIGTTGYAKRVAGLELFVCNPDEWWQHANRPPAGIRKLRRSAKL